MLALLCGIGCLPCSPDDGVQSSSHGGGGGGGGGGGSGDVSIGARLRDLPAGAHKTIETTQMFRVQRRYCPGIAEGFERGLPTLARAPLHRSSTLPRCLCVQDSHGQVWLSLQAMFWADYITVCRGVRGGVSSTSSTSNQPQPRTQQQPPPQQQPTTSVQL